MFEVRYKENNVIKTHIESDFDFLFDALKAHKDGKIKLLQIENDKHYSYNIENLLENLKV